MMYITPELQSNNSAAIQQAVNTAAESDIRTVVIPAGKVWQLDTPVCLPDHVTVILDGAQLRARGVAFTNSRAEEPPCLGSEQEHIYLLGTKGATITGGDGPQIAFQNVKDFGIRGIAFAGGDGVRLMHCRHGKVQNLRFSGSRHGIFLGEGCNNDLLGDIFAETSQRNTIAKSAFRNIISNHIFIRSGTVDRKCTYLILSMICLERINQHALVFLFSKSCNVNNSTFNCRFAFR